MERRQTKRRKQTQRETHVVFSRGGLELVCCILTRRGIFRHEIRSQRCERQEKNTADEAMAAALGVPGDSVFARSSLAFILAIYTTASETIVFGGGKECFERDGGREEGVFVRTKQRGWRSTGFRETRAASDFQSRTTTRPPPALAHNRK